MPTSSFLFRLLWLHTGQSDAQDPPQGGPTISSDSAQLPAVETLVIGSGSFTVNPTNIVIDSTTIAPDAAAVTVNHAAVSVDKSFDVFLNQSKAISGTGLIPPKTSVSNLGGPSNSSIGGSAPLAGSSIGGTALSGPSSTLKPSSPSSPPLGTSSSRPPSPPVGSGSSRLPVGTGSSSPSGIVPSIGGTSPSIRSTGTSSSVAPPIDTGSTRSPIPPVGMGSSYLSISPVGSSPSRLLMGTGPSGKGVFSSSLGGTAPVNSSPSINSSPSGGLPPPPSSSQSNNGTASVTSATSGHLLPGSTGKVISASTTSATTPSTATSGDSSTSANSDVPATTAPGAILPTSITLSGSMASSQESQFGSILIGFVNGGRSWASDITLPPVKTQAVQEVKDMLDNTENMIKNLGGDFPPSTNTCSGAGKRKRFFNPLGTVESLANDALGLANCINNIVNDISSEIGPLTEPPPAAGIIPTINAQLDALEKAGEEEEDSHSSTSGTTSSTASNTDSSSSSSTGSSSSSSTSRSSTWSSSSSSAPSACATYSVPTDDITQWEDIPDDSIGAQKRSAVEDNPDGRHYLAIRANSPPLTAINSCNFPQNMQALQPAYSELKGFTNLGKQPGGNAGAAGQVFNNAAKWYVTFSGLLPLDLYHFLRRKSLF
ncbi:hypothetical protein OEA41_007150 [Lepraria neglecta]|uniref:Uncharacterized protein n=1 Tax=Lepraria neglecta TaxID=209136 RepID=A0AAE0DNQ0_9LECA|nr:hypothetical protein OEA41_007150 [Lepraria neglecta]